jgi:hypothetical protein
VGDSTDQTSDHEIDDQEAAWTAGEAKGKTHMAAAENGVGENLDARGFHQLGPPLPREIIPGASASTSSSTCPTSHSFSKR